MCTHGHPHISSHRPLKTSSLCSSHTCLTDPNLLYCGKHFGSGAQFSILCLPKKWLKLLKSSPLPVPGSPSCRPRLADLWFWACVLTMISQFTALSTGGRARSLAPVSLLITAPMKVHTDLTSLLSFVASVEFARVPPARLLARSERRQGARPVRRVRVGPLATMA